MLIIFQVLLLGFPVMLHKMLPWTQEILKIPFRTFLGFLILGVFGNNYQASTLESNEFGTCYEYFKDKPPLEINCSFKIFDQSIFFGIVLAFIVAGILSLIKGAKGDWDSKIKPEDVVGPGNNQKKDSEDN